MKRTVKQQAPKLSGLRPAVRRSEKRSAWTAEKLASVGLAGIGLAQIFVAGAQVYIANRQTDVSERLEMLETARSKPRFFADSTVSAQYRFTQAPRHIRLQAENISGITWVSAQQLLFGVAGSRERPIECTFLVPGYFDTLGPNIRESWSGEQIRLNDDPRISENSPGRLWVIALTTYISVSYEDLAGTEGTAHYSYVDGTMAPLTAKEMEEYESRYPTLSATRPRPGKVELQMEHIERQQKGDNCHAFMDALGD